jgi:cytochrome c
MKIATIVACAVVALGAADVVNADEFTKEDLARWQEQFDGVVKEGRALWTDSKLGKNGVVCAQCHPETYPKFQKQLGKVASLWEMVNWCLRNPLEGDPLAADDPKMTAMLAYIAWERRGVKLEPGKH